MSCQSHMSQNFWGKGKIYFVSTQVDHDDDINHDDYDDDDYYVGIFF